MDESNQSQAPQSTGQVIDVKVTPAPTDSEPVASSHAFNPIVPPAQADELTTSSVPKETSNLPGEQPISEAPAGGPPSEHKAGAPIVAIVAAIAIALGLAAVTVYAYLKTQETDTKQPETSQTTTQEPATEVTGEDVDQTTADVDEALEATEEADFPESELTDENLGL